MAWPRACQTTCAALFCWAAGRNTLGSAAFPGPTPGEHPINEQPSPVPGRRLSHVVFDFDGTLSWLRHGWPDIMLEIFRRHLPRQEGEDEAAVDGLLRRIVLGMNGDPTLLQMIRFAALARERGWRLDRTVDLTSLEMRGEIVEGTGSLVFDREARLAYASRSARTHAPAVEAACAELGYDPVLFDAHDEAGREIYHTNVLMSVGPSIAVLASSMIAPGAGLRRVFDALDQSDKQLLDISAAQVAEFAGNVLFLDGGAQGPLVALSRRAWASLTRAQRLLLEQHARPVLCGVETIEHVGGGGIRCMLAEIFLPRRLPD